MALIHEGTHKAAIAAFSLRNVDARHPGNGAMRKVPVLDITVSVQGHGNVKGSIFLANDDARDGKASSQEYGFDRLRKLGWNGEPDGQFRGLIGRDVDVEVEHKVSGGKTYANVKYFNVPVTSSVDPAAAAALFGASVKPFEAHDDTDVPF